DIEGAFPALASTVMLPGYVSSSRQRVRSLPAQRFHQWHRSNFMRMQEVRELFLKLNEIQKRIEAVNHKTSYPFNFLRLFNIDERKMSDILAFLINPLAEHGQGDLYLRKFIQMMGIKLEDIRNVEIRRECQ